MRVVGLDKLTYFGNLDSFSEIASHPRYRFERVDICDRPAVRRLFELYPPAAVVHLAAELHGLSIRQRLMRAGPVGILPGRAARVGPVKGLR
jgi:dTDP-D-glucose 4,6-dehydratase